MYQVYFLFIETTQRKGKKTKGLGSLHNESDSVPKYLVMTRLNSYNVKFYDIIRINAHEHGGRDVDVSETTLAINTLVLMES